jgi:hypothetical protein
MSIDTFLFSRNVIVRRNRKRNLVQERFVTAFLKGLWNGRTILKEILEKKQLFVSEHT